jgi:tetratricopeptide (TPR) repeat protein
MENLLLLATMTDGLTPRNDGFEHVADSSVAELVPDLHLVDDNLYREFAGSPIRGAGFAGLQPDVLGERYILDRLSANGVAGRTARRLLLSAWSFQPRDLGVVAIRARVDFPGEQGLGSLFDVPIDTPDARLEWADMVGDLMAVTSQSTDELAASHFRKLVAVSDQHPQERGLQISRARAEFNLGGILLFNEDNPAAAATLYDASIARAGDRSAVGIMAIHNRGILRHKSGDLDGAFADYTVMIDQLGASDERRASALNNRADVFAERGDHENSIRDRSAILALQNTTADRRYIALFRRSRSHFFQGNDQAGLADLDAILATDDISPHQKAEARVERAVCLRRLGRLQEAEVDLDVVFDANEYFPSTRARACVDMALLQRDLKRPGQSRMYLDYAEAEDDANQQTLIDALIVRGLLAEEAGDKSEAVDFWKAVLASPDAMDTQKQFATDRLQALPQ